MHFEDELGFDAVVGQKPMGSLRSLDIKAKFPELHGHLENGGPLPFGNGDEHGSLFRKSLLSGLLRLEKGEPEGIPHSQDFPGGSHLRPQERINFWEHVEREDRFLHAKVPNRFGLDVKVGEFLPEHKLSGNAGHGNVADLGNQGNGSRGTGVGFKDINGILRYGVLDVHQTDHSKLHCDLSGILANGLNVLGGNADGGYHASGITGVDTSQLDMLHNGGNKGIRPVGNGICLGFNGILQEFVYENGTLGRHAHGCSNIMFQHLLVVDNLHTTSAEYVGGPDHQGIAYPFGNSEGFIEGACHVGFRLGNAQLAHHLPEAIAIFSQIYSLRRCADNLDTTIGQFIGDIERGLTPKLHDYALRLFLFVNA